MQNVKCKQCGDKIKRHVYKYDKKRGKFCSRDCFYKSQRAKKETFNCDYCGKSSEKDSWRATARPLKHQFCSRECYGKFKQTTQRRPDVTIEKVVELYNKGLKHKEIAIELSTTTGVIGDRIKRAGIKPDRGRYTNGLCNSKSIILKTYGNKCTICGWDKGRCDFHHIIKRRDGGSDYIENLLIICPNHHRLIHDKKIQAHDIVRTYVKT